jgi:hypothetical protein
MTDEFNQLIAIVGLFMMAAIPALLGYKLMRILQHRRSANEK